MAPVCHNLNPSGEHCPLTSPAELRKTLRMNWKLHSENSTNVGRRCKLRYGWPVWNNVVHVYFFERVWVSRVSWINIWLGIKSLTKIYVIIGRKLKISFRKYNHFYDSSLALILKRILQVEGFIEIYTQRCKCGFPRVILLKDWNIEYRNKILVCCQVFWLSNVTHVPCTDVQVLWPDGLM